MFHIFEIVKHRLKAVDQIIIEVVINFKKVVPQMQLNTNKTIALDGIAYTNGSQILLIDGKNKRKHTNTAVATSQTMPADNNVIINLLFFFFNTKSFFEFVKSFKVIPNIWHILCKTLISGIDSPFSHFETDLSEKLSICPSFVWVKFDCFLYLLIFFAITKFKSSMCT